MRYNRTMTRWWWIAIALLAWSVSLSQDKPTQTPVWVDVSVQDSFDGELSEELILAPLAEPVPVDTRQFMVGTKETVRPTLHHSLLVTRERGPPTTLPSS